MQFDKHVYRIIYRNINMACEPNIIYSAVGLINHKVAGSSLIKRRLFKGRNEVSE